MIMFNCCHFVNCYHRQWIFRSFWYEAATLELSMQPNRRLRRHFVAQSYWEKVNKPYLIVFYCTGATTKAVCLGDWYPVDFARVSVLNCVAGHKWWGRTHKVLYRVIFQIDEFFCWSLQKALATWAMPQSSCMEDRMALSLPHFVDSVWRLHSELLISG
jgi:hypothetical protein